MRSAIKQKGFTLVEVMIVVALLGIMTAIATPMITSMLPRYRLRAEARELVINFKKAKMEAVKNTRNVVLSFTPGVGTQGGSYQIFVENSNPPNYIYNAGTDRQLILKPMSQGVLLSNVTFTANRTWYDSRGMVSLVKTGNCEIRTSDDSKRYRLVLSTTGVVRLETSGDGGATWSAQ